MTQVETVRPPLDEKAARTLTEQIRNASEKLWQLILLSHEGRAWVSLGYESWHRYIEAEFGMSRSTAYRLLSQGEVTLELEAAAGIRRADDDPPLVTLTEAVELKGATDQLAGRLADETKGKRQQARRGVARDVIDQHLGARSENLNSQTENRTSQPPQQFPAAKETEVSADPPPKSPVKAPQTGPTAPVTARPREQWGALADMRAEFAAMVRQIDHDGPDGKTLERLGRWVAAAQRQLAAGPSKPERKAKVTTMFKGEH